jgi:histidinol-phosphate aminotransferase
VAETRGKIVAERDRLVALLRELRLEYAEPQGNFVFLKTGKPYQEIVGKFRADSVGIARPFPPFTEWVRISIGLPEENARAQAVLRKIFS